MWSSGKYFGIVKFIWALVLQVGIHDKLGMQIVPLRLLTPHETKEFTLNLVKNTNPNDPHNKKWRGKLVVELTFKPFIDDSELFSGSLHGSGKSEDMVGKGSEDVSLNRAGLLLVLLQGAEMLRGIITTTLMLWSILEENRRKPRWILTFNTFFNC